MVCTINFSWAVGECPKEAKWLQRISNHSRYLPRMGCRYGAHEAWSSISSFFAAVARYQYSVADFIGVQTEGNLSYFNQWRQKPSRKLEVLQNWLDKPASNRCSIRIDETTLAGRKIFVYAGNMGVAQGWMC